MLAVEAEQDIANTTVCSFRPRTSKEDSFGRVDDFAETKPSKFGYDPSSHPYLGVGMSGTYGQLSKEYVETLRSFVSTIIRLCSCLTLSRPRSQLVGGLKVKGKEVLEAVGVASECLENRFNVDCRNACNIY